MAAAIAICAVAALGLSLFLSANPSSFIDYLITTIARNDIKAFGMKHRGLKDKSKVRGLVTGGNLRSVETLSRTEREKLKNSPAARSLSQREIEQIKNQLGSK